MSDSACDPLPPELADIGERMRASRPVPSDDALDRAATRARRAARARDSSPWRMHGPWSRRTLTATIASAALAVGAVGTASAVTISLTGLGSGSTAAVKEKLTGPSGGGANLDDPAQAQYGGDACLTARVTLAKLKALSAPSEPAVRLQEELVRRACGG